MHKSQDDEGMSQ